MSLALRIGIGIALAQTLGLASAQEDAVAPAPLGDAALAAYQCQRAAYPVAALRKGVQGEVWVRFVVRDDGSFDALAVHQSAGPSAEHQRLDAASLQQLRSCRHVGPGARIASGAYRVRLSWQIDG